MRVVRLSSPDFRPFLQLEVLRCDDNEFTELFDSDLAKTFGLFFKLFGDFGLSRSLSTKSELFDEIEMFEPDFLSFVLSSESLFRIL